MEREEFYFLSSDKHTQVHGYCWKPEGEATAVLQISHGMMEHIGRYDRFASWMTDRGIAVIGHDHLGHGMTGNKEDLSFFAEKKGAVCLVQDLFRVTEIMEMRYPDIPHIMLGHSMGSFLARRYVTVHGERLDGLILMGTGGQPLWMACAGKLAALVVGAVNGMRHQSYLMEEQTTRAFGGSRDENGTYRIDEYDVLPEGVFLSMELPGLKKGVYDVQIAYDADAEQVSRVSSDSAGYRKLYTNTVSLRPSNIQKEVAYRFMLLENADDLRVEILYTGAGTLAVTDFRVVHTRQEYGMGLFFVVLFSLLADILLYFLVWNMGKIPGRTER